MHDLKGLHWCSAAELQTLIITTITLIIIIFAIPTRKQCIIPAGNKHDHRMASQCRQLLHNASAGELFWRRAPCARFFLIEYVCMYLAWCWFVRYAGSRNLIFKRLLFTTMCSIVNNLLQHLKKYLRPESHMPSFYKRCSILEKILDFKCFQYHTSAEKLTPCDEAVIWWMC